MKRITILLLLSILFYFASAQQEKEFVVRGTLRNVEDGIVFYLMKEYGNVGVQVTSDTLKNGKFSLKWKIVDGTEKFSLFTKSRENGFPRMSLSLWVKSNSLIEVIGNDKWIYTWEVKNDVPEQIEQRWFINANRTDWNEFQHLTVKYATLPKKQIKTSEEKMMADSLNRLIQIVRKRIALNEIKLFKQKPIETDAGMDALSFAASVMTEEKDSSRISELKEIYNQLPIYQKKSREGCEINAVLYPSKRVKEGDWMSDGVLFDLNDNKQELSDYKGKYLLLDFWSNGCGACISSFPKLKEIHEKQKDRLTIIGINMDDTSLWKKMNQSYNITWINLNDKKGISGLATKYGLKMMPLYVFVSPEGKILFSTSYWDELVKNMVYYVKF